MRRIALRDAQIGMQLARAVYNERGDILLNFGVRLNERYLQELGQRGVRFIYVEDPDTDDVVIEDVISERVRLLATRDLFRVYSALQQVTEPLQRADATQRRRALHQRDFAARVRELPGWEDLQRDLELVIEETIGVETFNGITTLRAFDGYTFVHVLDETIVALLIGRRLNLARAQLRELAAGCLLHDIGKVFIPKEILNKPGRLTPEEMAQIREHPRLGYELLRTMRPKEILANHVAYQHHERQDGRGYPRGLRGSNRVVRDALASRATGGIILYAEIAAVADVYDALSSDRPYRQALPPDAVVAALREAAGAHLNREVVRTFLDLLPVYPLGTEVLVRSGPRAGHRGVVVQVAPDQLDRPVVRLLFNARGERLPKPIELDLREEREVILIAF